MKIFFANTYVESRCRTLLAMNRDIWMKARTCKAAANHAYAFLVNEGLLEARYPFKPIGEYNQYRLTEKGSIVSSNLRNLFGADYEI